jgi:hypothetical protein
MPKHTPGPWCYDDHNFLIDSADGYPIASVKLPTKATYPQSVKTKDPERAANARLIVAAPELLKALKEFVKLRSDDLGPDLEPLRKAIAKAEGR